MSRETTEGQSGGPDKVDAETMLRAVRTGTLPGLVESMLDEPAPAEEEKAPPEPKNEPLESSTEEESTSGENAEETVLSQVESEDDGTEPESTDEESSPEEESPLIKDDDPHGVKKRIGKLSKKVREAEERAEAYKAELESLQEQADKEPTALPASEGRYDSVNDLNELAAKQREAREVVRYCDRKLRECLRRGEDEVEDEIAGKTVKLSVDRLEELRDNAQDALDSDIPARREFLTRRSQVLPEIHKVFPYFKDRTSQEYQAAMEVVRAMPEIRRHPDWELKVGVYLAGLSYLRAQANGANKKPAPKKAPAQPSTPAATPPKVDKAKVKVDSARNRFKKRNDRDSLASLLEAAEF